MHRRSWIAVAAFVLSSFHVVSAVAAQLPFTGALSIAIEGLPVVLVPGAGVATLNPTASGLHLESAILPARAFARTGFAVSVSAASAFPIAGVQVTAANGNGTIVRSAGDALGGAIPIQGVAKVCLFTACTALPPANVSVPVSVVGEGGTITAAGAVNVTVQGAPWTTGITARSTGSVQGPNGLASSTAQAGGRLNLVTPIFISTNIGALAQISANGRIEHPLPRAAALLRGFGRSRRVRRWRHAGPDAPPLRKPGLRQRGSALRLEFVVPVGGGFAVPVLDGDVTLAPGFDTDIAPVTAFTVDASQPRGDYQLRCRISDPGGVTIDEGAASFRFD